MTEIAGLGDTSAVVLDRAVWVEPTGVSSAVVRQLLHYEGGKEVETETPFTSLSEALAFARELYRDDSSRDLKIIE